MGLLAEFDESNNQIEQHLDSQLNNGNIDDLTRSFAVEKRFNTQGATPKEYLKSVSFQIKLSCKF